MISEKQQRDGASPRLTFLRRLNITSIVHVGLLVAQVALLLSLTLEVREMKAIQRDSESQASQQIMLDRIPDERGHILGPVTAPITLVEFSDFECPWCARAWPATQRLMTQYPGKVRLVYRHFPKEEVHPNAFKAAEASECAAEQGKFWEMHDLLLKNQARLDVEALPKYAQHIGLDSEGFSSCLASGRMSAAVQQDLSTGIDLGISGTPTFFVNKKRVTNTPELEAEVRRAFAKR